MASPVEMFLEDQLPLKYQADIPLALKTAYAAAAQLAKDEPIFSTASAKANHGRLIAWAVDLSIEKLVLSGAWPFDRTWASFNQPTGKYLKIILPESTLSISQVETYKKPPRKVGFRGNAALSNQSYLFPDMEKERKRIVELPSFILIHGHQNLNFAHIGMSAPNQNDWIHRSGNLLNIAHDVSDNQIPPVELSEDPVLALKDEIAKWRRDGNR